MTISPRRRARHAVLQALYAHSLSGDSPSHIFKTVLQPRLPKQEGAMKMGIRLFNKVISEQEDLDQIIEGGARNWDLNRILRTDLIILRMAICEFLFFYHIPPKVTMNEAIELSKIFSTEESKDFVNGVLDTISVRLREEGKLVKSEGGLQGWDEMVNRQDAQRTR
ncbi:MAG: transcription antitermination factor NusB [Bacteroidetes bacterium]|nr:transcription antitermination factor NusB [Bacteroidota bacterium]MCY4204325.1 transcription antitermination factor NusB [Bacteroidota bacterium]